MRSLQVSLIVFATLSIGTTAHSTLIDFEDLTPGTNLDDGYSSLGITFQRALDSTLNPTDSLGTIVTSSIAEGNYLSIKDSSTGVYIVLDDAVQYVSTSVFETNEPDPDPEEEPEPVPDPEPEPEPEEDYSVYLKAYGFEDGSYNQLNTSVIVVHATTNWQTISFDAGSNLISAFYLYGVGYNFKVDDIYTGSPVPEPATILLFGAGIAGLIGSRLKRKK